jgi:hypothetical protein
MPRRNRVDPWGDLHAVSARGLLTGNRGCIVDEREQVVRHHRSSTLWITCLTEFRDWRVPLARPNRWTPIFFLDDAVALAAGHRPCATCRRDMYRSYRDAVDPALRAVELDRRLTTERLRRGSGIDRGRDRKTGRLRRRSFMKSLPKKTGSEEDDGSHAHRGRQFHRAAKGCPTLLRGTRLWVGDWIRQAHCRSLQWEITVRP